MVELAPSFKLEFEALDNEHQGLVDIVNKVTQAIDDDRGGDCEALVTEFIESTKRHFAREEALLHKIGYPNVKKHQKHHKNLNAKMAHMLEFAKMAGENQMARESLRKELVFFLMDDVITTDLEFKDFIDEEVDEGKS